jgi:hypothetical protein
MPGTLINQSKKLRCFSWCILTVDTLNVLDSVSKTRQLPQKRVHLVTFHKGFARFQMVLDLLNPYFANGSLRV